MLSLELWGLANDRRGVTTLQYGLIAMILGVLVLTAVATRGACR